MNNKLLWQNIRLPVWNSARLFELFQRHTGGKPTPREKEDYACQLMVYIAANMARGRWFASLRRAGLDPEDVAADLLCFLIQKTPSIHLGFPCEKVLLKVLNVTIYRWLVSAVRQQTVKVESLPGGDRDEGGRFVAASHETPFLEPLRGALRQAEDTICKGHWPDQIALCVLYRYLCRQVIRQNTILAYSQLPLRLQRKVSIEQHAVISYQLNKFIQRFAADYA